MMMMNDDFISYIQDYTINEINVGSLIQAVTIQKLYCMIVKKFCFQILVISRNPQKLKFFENDQ